MQSVQEINIKALKSGRTERGKKNVSRLCLISLTILPNSQLYTQKILVSLLISGYHTFKEPVPVYLVK